LDAPIRHNALIKKRILLFIYRRLSKGKASRAAQFHIGAWRTPDGLMDALNRSTCNESVIALGDGGGA
jgi:hypothetical protein